MTYVAPGEADRTVPLLPSVAILMTESQCHTTSPLRALLQICAGKRLPLTLGAILGVGLAGCATTGVKPINTEVENRSAKGFRFYGEAPFVLVTPDGVGGIKSELIYLPDLRRKYSVRPLAFLATNKTTLTISNGVLGGVESKVDATTVPASVIGVAAEVAKSKLGGSFDSYDGPPRTHGIDGPLLFEIRNEGGHYHLELVEGNQTEKIQIPLPADVTKA